MTKPTPSASPLARHLRYSIAFCRYLIHRLNVDQCTRSAAALTYMSLFAVVPLMTVIYAMFSAVPAFQSVGDQIQSIIFEHFVPTTGQEVQEYLAQFSSQARKLTGVGIAFLLVTALLMLKNIESTFNSIWRTRGNRRGLSSFLLYWAILSLGPLCIGLALGISTYLVSLKVLFDQVDVLGAGTLLLGITPYLLTSAAFTLLFVAVPNCRVPIKHALIGGLVTAFAFELAKKLFAAMVSGSSYELIYGTFAAIPLFLLWIYLSWLILLAGAEFVQALSGRDLVEGERHSDLTLSLAILEKLWRCHLQGQTLRERDLLRERWLFDSSQLPRERWTTLRDPLIRVGLLKVSENGHFLLGRDLHTFTLSQLEQLLHEQAVAEPLQEQSPPWHRQAQQLIGELNSQQRKILSPSLAELFESSKQTP